MPLNEALGVNDLKSISYWYIGAASYCVLYWLIFFVPFTRVLIGSDGSWYVILGIFSLCVLPVAIIGWFIPNVRESVNFDLGKSWANVLIITIMVFVLFGVISLLSLYTTGI